jgi:hypothetical protein
VVTVWESSKMDNGRKAGPFNTEDTEARSTRSQKSRNGRRAGPFNAEDTEARSTRSQKKWPGFSRDVRARREKE